MELAQCLSTATTSEGRREHDCFRLIALLPSTPLPFMHPFFRPLTLRLCKLDEDEAAKATLVAIHSKFATMTAFLSDEDDDVSEEIIPFAAQYVGLLKVWSGGGGRGKWWRRSSCLLFVCLFST